MSDTHGKSRPPAPDVKQEQDPGTSLEDQDGHDGGEMDEMSKTQPVESPQLVQPRQLDQEIPSQTGVTDEEMGTQDEQLKTQNGDKQEADKEVQTPRRSRRIGLNELEAMDPFHGIVLTEDDRLVAGKDKIKGKEDKEKTGSKRERQRSQTPSSTTSIHTDRPDSVTSSTSTWSAFSIRSAPLYSRPSAASSSSTEGMTKVRELSNAVRKKWGVTIEVFGLGTPKVDLQTTAITAEEFLAALNTARQKEETFCPPEMPTFLIDARNFFQGPASAFDSLAEQAIQTWKATPAKCQATMIWVFEGLSDISYKGEVMVFQSRVKWVRALREVTAGVDVVASDEEGTLLLGGQEADLRNVPVLERNRTRFAMIVLGANSKPSLHTDVEIADGKLVLDLEQDEQMDTNETQLVLMAKWKGKEGRKAGNKVLITEDVWKPLKEKAGIKHQVSEEIELDYSGLERRGG